MLFLFGLFLFTTLFFVGFVLCFNVHLFLQDKHIAAFFGLKFFFGVTTNEDAYHAGKQHFTNAIMKYAKLGKTQNQRVLYLASMQLDWILSLIPSTQNEDPVENEDGDDGGDDLQFVSSLVSFFVSSLIVLV